MITLVLAFAALAPEPAFAGDTPRPWREATAPFRIAGPLSYVGTRGLGVYLFETKAGLILLSGAMPGSDGLIVASIKKLGYDPKDIHLILTTHAHIDHAGTIAALKKLTKAPVATMAGDVGLLASGGKQDYLFGQRPDMQFEGVKADRILKDGDTVTLGDVTLTAHATPGHTRGCTTWETRLTVDGKVYDVVFADGLSVNPGTRFGPEKPSYPGIADDYRRTFRTLEALKPDLFLSYHAEFFDLEKKRDRAVKEGVQAWVDPEGYARIVQKKKAELEALVARDLLLPR
jgi:metallo-beta-lactamase class B